MSAPFVTKQQDSVSKAGSIAEEALSNIKTIVAFGGEDKEARWYTSYTLGLYNINTQHNIML